MVRGLTERLRSSAGSITRASLARTAAVLTGAPVIDHGPLAGESAADYMAAVESTAWGPAHRLVPPLALDGAPMQWRHRAGPLGAAPPRW